MISVIVPVYNVYPFLGECIETIRNQTYNDLEIILIDDGSTDKSGEICDIYAEKDSRIKTIHQENKGLSGARNTGILYAEGEYIIFVDSDDKINPMMIQLLYDTMLAYNADITLCSHKTFLGENSEKTGFQEIKVNTQNIEILSGRECVKQFYSQHGVDMVVAWNKLYRKSMFYKMKYPLGRLHEDEFLTYKILYPLKKCVYIKIPLYEYRVREGSIMESRSIRRLEDKMAAFEERYNFFEKNGDVELYRESLRRYETSIAELILYLKENKGDKAFESELIKKFKLTYKEKVISSGLKLRHKLKFKIFIINKFLYKKLKEIDGRRLRRKYG